MKTITYNPETHVLVPREPSEEMLQAALRANMQHVIDCINDPAKSKDIEWKEQLADIGQATMAAIRAHAYPGWSPAQCPSEIVGDLRNECDELRAKLDGATKVVAALIQVARAAWHASDDSEEVLTDDGRAHRITGPDFDALSDALDALDELPDDQPGCVMHGPARAEWALRNLLCSAA